MRKDNVQMLPSRSYHTLNRHAKIIELNDVLVIDLVEERVAKSLDPATLTPLCHT